MSPVANTALYAGLCGLMLFALSVRVIRGRKARSLPMGDGGDEALVRLVRAHANFCEYVPLALILIAAVELAGYPAWLVHVLGAALVAGRLSHAWSMATQRLPARIGGMMLTFLVLLAGSTLAIAAALGG